MTPPPTDDSRELSKRLGAVRAEYPPLPAWRRYLFAYLLFGVYVLTGLLFDVTRGTFFATALMLPIAVIAFLVLAYGAHRRGATHVTLYSGGLVLRERDTVVVDFDEVDELWFELAKTGWISTIRAMRVVEHGGRCHTLQLGKERVDLANAVIRNCSLRHVPDARRALAGGETLKFGRVELTSSGVAVAGKFVPWNELKLVRIMSGSVAFLRRQTVVAWRTVPLDQVPHPGMFMILVQELAPQLEIDPLMQPPTA